MVVFDTSTLVIAFDPSAKVPLVPGTNTPIERCAERVKFLLSSLSDQKQKIVIPTPVLAEYLVLGGVDRAKRLHAFTSSKQFNLAPFDLRAAVECAEITDGVQGRVKDGESKAKVKFDRQIIAIAKVLGAAVIYTGDKGLAKCASENGLRPVMTWELPLPPPDRQGSLLPAIDPFIQRVEPGNDPFVKK